jgi:sodium transport system permease protein
MRGALTVFRKEFVENLRDRRTLFAALLIGPVFGPLLLAAMLQFTVKRGEAEAEKPIALAVVNAGRAPNLLAWLGERRVTVERVSLDENAIRNSVRERRHEMVLEIPAGYGERFTAAKPAPLLLYVDESSLFGGRQVERLEALIRQYNATVGSLRLVARGVDPLVTQPISLQSIDVSTPRSRAVLAIGMLSYIIVFATLMGGFYLAIDATAGERERGSLEPLLTTPVPREQLVYGKILATCSYMLISLAATVAACTVVLALIGLEAFGMSANFGPTTAALVILYTAPLVPLGAGVLAIVASFTRSYREAQTYLSFVLLVPTLPLAFVNLLGLKPTAALMAVPSLSQHFLITYLLRDETIPPAQLAVSIAASLGLGVALAWVAGRLCRREAILGN